MSLKAKIEAVIYASEEPVTLAQLVSLLGEEAQAELDRAAADQLTLLDDGEQEAAAEAELALEMDFDSVDGAAVEASEASHPSGEPPAVDVEGVAVAAAAAAASDPQIAAYPADSGAADLARSEKARAGRLRAYFRTVLDRLIADYAAAESDRGLEIREVAGGFKFATKPEYHDAVRGFVKSLKPPLKLTLQALETLAVVAYKQPVTSPEISEIRGVDSSGVLGSLIARKLITTAGRKHVIGRPILYKTTREFLLKFGLKDVAELPSIEEFEKMAGQMEEQEEIPMADAADPRPDIAESAEKLEPERHKSSPQADGDSAPADDVSEQTGDKASVDGRVSSLPPKYDDDEDDRSAE